MGRPWERMGLRRQLTLALFWFGISFVWGALLAVTLPFILVPEHAGPHNPALVAPGAKNTALSILETAGLLIALHSVLDQIEAHHQ